MRTMLNQKDKVILITGGNGGIGLATGVLFAQHGASVMLAARNFAKGQTAVEQIRKMGGTASFIQCDVRIAEDCNRAVEKTVEQYSHLDVLFNNAGIVRRGRIDETDEATWDDVMDINLKGIFLMSKAAIKVMSAQGRGVIINNASDSGIVGEKGLVAYCASKGGVVLMTRAMAIDHAAKGIRVNAICPGATYVPRWDDRAKAGGYDVQDDIDEFIRRIPMGRVASTLEIANAVLFLASDASTFVIGETLILDGGTTAK